jgi:hypothetical protein
MIDPTTGVDDGTGPQNPVGTFANGILSPMLSPNYATPEQRKQMYAYANALLAPQPVTHWAQGLGEIARSLVGGYMSHQADVAEQASRANTQNEATPTGGASSVAMPSAQGATQAATPAASSLASYFTSQGLPPAAAAGLVGGFGAESGLNPNASRAGDGSDGSTSRGLAQWNGQRAQNLAAFASKYGLNPSDPKTQADFSLNELGIKGQKGDPGYGSEASSGRALMAAQTPQDATNAAVGYERPQGYSAAHPENSLAYGKRLTMAQALMGHAGQAPAAAPAAIAGAIRTIQSPSGPIQVDARGNALDPATGRPTQAPAQAFAPTQSPMGGSPMQSAPQAPMAPRAPMQVAQNSPAYSPQQLGAMAADPNLPEAMRAHAMSLTQPTMATDANGNVSPIYQGQRTGAPIFQGGRAIQQGTDSVPGVVSGPINAPTTTIAPPVVAGAPPVAGGGLPSNAPTPPGTPGQPNSAGGAPWMRPGSVVGDMIAQKQQNDAQGAAVQAAAAANQARYQKTQQEGPALLQASYPLRQIQGILEKNGGQLPSGEGSQNVMGAASLTNMVATLLGHPLTADDSRLTSMELLHKYGTQIAQTQAASLGVHPTNMELQSAGETSPGTSLSGPANLHLVDNLVRLNSLAQKKAQFEHDYYLSHGSGPTAYDNFTQDWQKQISGPNAVPLSKYGRNVTLKDGSKAMYVPSTDPAGFSLFRADDPQFKSTVMTPGQ